MSRPELLRVDAAARPREMQLLFPGDPARLIRVRLKDQDASPDRVWMTALAEIAALTPRDLALLYESAQPIPVVVRPDPAPFGTATVEPVSMEPRPAGHLFCPRCGWKLGRADSPAIQYVRQCAGCHREIAIAILNGTVVVATSAEDTG